MACDRPCFGFLRGVDDGLLCIKKHPPNASCQKIVLINKMRVIIHILQLSTVHGAALMKIAIIAMGSRGDVQPYIALGKGLKISGYDVRLITHENFNQLVTSHGLEFYPVRGNVQSFLEDPENRKLLESGDFLAINARAAEATKSAAVSWAEDSLVACQEIDLLISGVGGLFLSIAIAEKLNLPLLQAYIFPFTPTKTFPAIVFPPSVDKLGGMFNWLSHQLFRYIMWLGARAGDRLARQQVLALPKTSFLKAYRSLNSKGYPILYGFSPSVIDEPSDWSNSHITGYWFLDEEPTWEPPAALLDFLNNGPPPIFVGFGSMVSRNPEETANLVLQAIQLTGQRAILQSGWSGLSQRNLPSTVMMVDSVPHSWLFPRVLAVIHHGGAGTTSAGLRAGVPSIVIPFFGDQPFWGRRLAKLGVAPDPIPRKRLTAERLAAAINEVLSNRKMRECAVNLGIKIRAENGVDTALKIIDGIKKAKSLVE